MPNTLCNICAKSRGEFGTILALADYMPYPLWHDACIRHIDNENQNQSLTYRNTDCCQDFWHLRKLNKIKDLTGMNVEIMAARSIAKAFDKLKLPYDRTAKSNEPSFTKNLH